jgi:hypothetical protein
MAARGGIGAAKGGPAEAAARNAALLRGRAFRMRNLQRPAVVTAESCNTMIAKAYATKREPFGGAWPPLKYRKEPPPTLQSAANTSKNATKVTASRGDLRFYTTEHLFFHMSDPQSSKRTFPKRNPTPLQYVDGKGWMFKPQVVRAHARRVRQWIETGTVTA